MKRRLVALLALSALLMVGAAATRAAGGGPEDSGKELFLKTATPPCAICHSLNDAGATGMVGPSLDDLKPDAQRVSKAIRNGIGQMPAYGNLKEDQVEAIARYVARATGAAD